MTSPLIAPAVRRLCAAVTVPPCLGCAASASSADGSAIGARRRYHVAVVGSGPAGFYTTKYLFKQAKVPIRVDMYERLPCPFGLVRFGVAPDHPEVKNVIHDFAAVAGTEGFRFLGNIEVGRGGGVPLEALRKAYDAVVVCSGAEGERLLQIPGEDLRGVVGAPSFVKWYNGHPDFASLKFGDPGESVVVIGQGNVALDVARVLLRSPSELHPTDVEAEVVASVAKWQKRGLRTVDVVGRRGFVQAAFTNAELRELLTFSDEVLSVVDPAELAACRNAASEEELSKSRVKKRSVEILEKMAANFDEVSTTSKRVLRLRFLSAPRELIPDSTSARVRGVRLGRMKLQGEPGSQVAVEEDPSSVGEVLPCGLLVRSVGFGMTPLEGMPADPRNGYAPHEQGRVELPGGESGGGLYVSGWCKRGPTGIIASNIPDAQETSWRLLADLVTSSSRADVSIAEQAIAATGRRVVSFADWQLLQAEELRRGECQGRVADKFTSVREMLDFLGRREASPEPE